MTTVADRAARLQAAGLAASDDGRPALAARRLRAALRILSREPELTEARARVLVSLAWAESERGHVDLGHRLLDEAERLVPDHRRPLLHAQRAVLFERNGRNDLALREFDAAIAGLNERDGALDLVKALNNRSLMYSDAGRVGAARDDLLRALRIASRHRMELGCAMVRLNLACLQVIAGDLPAALRAFAVCRSDFQRVAPGRLSAISVEQARALIAAGLFREADAELAAAMAQAQQQQQGHTYADALQVRAEAALLAGSASSAAQWAWQARAQFRARRNPRRAALAALLVVRAEYADRGPASADLAARGRRSAAELRRLGLIEDARVADLVVARCLAHTGSAQAAARLVDRHGPPGRVDRLDTRLLWRLTRAELGFAAGRPVEASRHLVAGMAVLHRYRAQFGCLDLQTGASAHGQDLARAGLRAALNGGSVAAVYRWSERSRAQALLLPAVRPPDDPADAAVLEDLRQTRYALREAELAGHPAVRLRAQAERLQRTVRERSWSLPGRPLAPSSPAPLGRIRAELGDAALVAYVRDGPRLVALVVTRSSACTVPLGGFRTAEEAVLRLRADLDAQAGRAMPRRLAAAVAHATREDAATLAAAVLDPLWSLVGDRDLVVVPTGMLMSTPWALPPGCAGRPITVAPSATAWLAAVHRRAAAGTGGGTILVAGPGIRRGEQEVRAIAGVRPAVTVLAGASATPAATLAALDGAAIAHVAAHGRHQAENALFSALELAGGPVLGYDLQRVARPPTMVVLSSCELGLTDVRPGDESFGMASALLAAGTATVVASVSRVADDDAMRVMVAYHRAVAAGCAPAAALAAAGPAGGFVCLGAG